MKELEFEERQELKEKPKDTENLGFGQIFTDYMLQMDYSPEQGWHDMRIIPFGDITMSPANVSLHYGQLIFEGLKAYKTPDNHVNLFRPLDNMNRLNRSGSRFCIPPMDAEKAVEGLAKLIEIEKDWIPEGDGCALYIRPFTIATEEFLGVRPSKTYSFFTILSPVGSYYKEGISPIKIYVEDQYVRAVRGGTGDTKCAGNYAASMISQEQANELGYSQVLWLDGVERKYIEEIGTTNAFFVIDNQVITPELNGSILPGITRDSTIKLLKHWGIDIVERKLSIDELVEAYDKGTLNEAFATGTAAVISPIGELKYKEKVMPIGDGEPGEIAMRIYDALTKIQRSEMEDPFNWVYRVV